MSSCLASISRKSFQRVAAGYCANTGAAAAWSTSQSATMFSPAMFCRLLRPMPAMPMPAMRSLRAGAAAWANKVGPLRAVAMPTLRNVRRVDFMGLSDYYRRFTCGLPELSRHGGLNVGSHLSRHRHRGRGHANAAEEGVSDQPPAGFIPGTGGRQSLPTRLSPRRISSTLNSTFTWVHAPWKSKTFSVPAMMTT